MKHLCKVKGKLLLSLVLVLLLMISITGCINTSASLEEKRYSDRVHVSEHLFLATEEISDTLPTTIRVLVRLRTSFQGMSLLKSIIHRIV